MIICRSFWVSFTSHCETQTCHFGRRGACVQ